MKGAAWFAAGVAAVVFVRLTTVQGQGDCVPLPGHPGAVVCGVKVASGGHVALAAPLEGAATVETILADALATPLPTPNMRAPLPTWLPAGVLMWEDEIREASARVQLDPLALAILVAIECPSGNAGCRSHIDPPAVGLTQFMPGTADAVELRSGLPCSDRTDGPTSLRCGAYHLVELLSMCGALWRQDAEGDALACAGTGYSAGPGYIPAMKAHIRAGGDPRTAPIPAETRLWVSKALDMWTRAGRQ